MRISYLFTLIMLSVCLASPSGFTAAYPQMPPDSALSESTDSFLTLVPPRQIEEIENEMENADQARVIAIEAQRMAEQQRAAAAGKLQEIKKAIGANKERQKAAKRENKQGDLVLLKTEAKGLEREKKLMEERESLRDAEIELARKRNELATLTKQALELERQLALKRAGQMQTSVTGPESARAARVLIDLELGVLEAQKKVADKQGEVADGAKRVVERQLNTLRAQQNIYGGR